MRKRLVGMIAPAVVLLGWGFWPTTPVAAQDGAGRAEGLGTPPPASPKLDASAHPPKNERDDRSEPDGPDEPVPDWAYDARWYSIDVLRFHNGDKSNDPPGTAAWNVEGTGWEAGPNPGTGPAGGEVATLGGDLEGIRKRFAYLRALGVNAMMLSNVFERNLVASGVATEIESAHLRLLQFVREAHQAGLRILFVCGILQGQERQALSEIGRLTNQRGDGESSPGVDGWMLIGPKVPPKLTRKLKQSFRSGGRNVLFITDDSQTDKASLSWLGCRVFRPWDPEKMMNRALEVLSGRAEGRAGRGEQWKWYRCATLGCEMLLDAGSNRSSPGPSVATKTGRSPLHDAWRLRAVLTHFLPGAPVTDYGVEVGLPRKAVTRRNPPMWWTDLPDPAGQPPDYRGDFFALIQWLHKLRAEHQPLRRGDFRLVLNAAAARLFAFSRALPGDEVIVVMNYGETKRKVMLPCGRPGQMVVALTPMIDPSQSRLATLGKKTYDHTRIEPLPVGGGRGFVNREGEFRLWVEPMSIRVVLVSDREPRRP